MKKIFLLIFVSYLTTASASIDYNDPEITQNKAVYFVFLDALKSGFGALTDRMLQVQHCHPEHDFGEWNKTPLSINSKQLSFDQSFYHFTLNDYADHIFAFAHQCLTQALQESSFEPAQQQLITTCLTQHQTLFLEVFRPHFEQTETLEHEFRQYPGRFDEQAAPLPQELLQRTLQMRSEIEQQKALHAFFFTPHTWSLFSFIFNERDLFSGATPQPVFDPYVKLLQSYSRQQRSNELESAIICLTQNYTYQARPIPENLTNAALHGAGEQRPIEAIFEGRLSADQASLPLAALKAAYRAYLPDISLLPMRPQPAEAPTAARGGASHLRAAVVAARPSPSASVVAPLSATSAAGGASSSAALLPAARTAAQSSAASAAAAAPYPPTPSVSLSHGAATAATALPPRLVSKQQEMAADLKTLRHTLFEAGMSSQEIEDVIEENKAEQQRVLEKLIAEHQMSSSAHLASHPTGAGAAAPFTLTQAEITLLDTIQKGMEAISTPARTQQRTFEGYSVKNESVMAYGSDNPQAPISPHMRDSLQDLTRRLCQSMGVLVDYDPTSAPEILPWIEEKIDQMGLYRSDQKTTLKARLKNKLPKFFEKAELPIYKNFLDVVQQIQQLDAKIKQRDQDNWHVILMNLFEQLDSQIEIRRDGALETKCGTGCKGRTFIAQQALISFFKEKGWTL